MKDKKGSYCYMVISAKDDLPLGTFDTYKQLADYYDIAYPTVWRAINDHVIIKGKYYIEKILL